MPLRPIRSLFFWLSLLFLGVMTAAQRDGVLSISQDAYFKQLRMCAQVCVNDDTTNDDLEGLRGCSDTVIYDSCFCREDLRSQATSFFSSCIYKRCSFTDAGFNSVTSIYDRYCKFSAAAQQDGLATSTITSGTTPTVVIITTKTAGVDRESAGTAPTAAMKLLLLPLAVVMATYCSFIP